MDKGKVLVLGAGLVARPLVRYLLDHGFSVTVASRTESKAQAMIDGHPAGETAAWTIDQTDKLKELIGAHDLAVSLLPAPNHPIVAKECIAQGKHMVTTSYVSPTMRKLDSDAKAADVILLNEIGVDPGIDHMSIMRVLDHVRGKGGKLTSLYSCCGGLPAPDANTNPLGYKFSWSPAGVLVAMTGSVLFREKGERIDLPPGGLFECVKKATVADLGELEFYPNRDSLSYIDTYGLGDIGTMFRGTFRYPGWASLWGALWKIGLLDRSKRDDLAGKTWDQILAGLIGAPVGPELRQKVAQRSGVAADGVEMDGAAWLGLFEETPVSDAGTLLDCIADLLLTKMVYADGERDMLVMRHDFRAEYPDGTTEAITSTMLDYGIPDGDSSMARTVSLPAAIAVRMILEGVIAARGVHVPVISEIYKPVLEELATLDIVLEEVFETV